MTEPKRAPGERYMVPNDETGLWEVHQDGWWLAEFESESNAQGFAAAPELLEVAHQLAELGNVSEVWAAVKSQVGEGPFIKARAAIAKAEGRTT